MARRPQDFDFEPEPGETWEIFGQTYATNPKLCVPDEYWSVVQLWAACRGEFGLQHLPDAGGVNEQSAWLMDAFNVLFAADAETRKRESATAPP